MWIEAYIYICFAAAISGSDTKRVHNVFRSLKWYYKFESAIINRRSDTQNTVPDWYSQSSQHQFEAGALRHTTNHTGLVLVRADAAYYRVEQLIYTNPKLNVYTN